MGGPSRRSFVRSDAQVLLQDDVGAARSGIRLSGGRQGHRLGAPDADRRPDLGWVARCRRARERAAGSVVGARRSGRVLASRTSSLPPSSSWRPSRSTNAGVAPWRPRRWWRQRSIAFAALQRPATETLLSLVVAAYSVAAYQQRSAGQTLAILALAGRIRHLLDGCERQLGRDGERRVLHGGPPVRDRSDRVEPASTHRSGARAWRPAMPSRSSGAGSRGSSTMWSRTA